MVTTLYVVRHGHAVNSAPSDAERPLSEAGIAEVRQAAKHLAGVNPDVFLASPYLRAQQTAEIIREAAEISTVITTESGITPDDHPAAVESLLADLSASTALMVSHNPLVSALVSWLVEGHFQGPYAMGTASVACIDFENFGVGQGSLRWLNYTN